MNSPPPSESPPHTRQYSEPFQLDYQRWAAEIARLSHLLAMQGSLGIGANLSLIGAGLIVAIVGAPFAAASAVRIALD